MNFEDVFRQSFVPLQQVFGHDLGSDTIKIYFLHLSKRLSPEQFAKACMHVLDNFRPTSACKFPTPAHFIEYATGNAEDRATNAVSRVMEATRKVGPNRSVSFNDKVLHRTVERFGGWEAMRDMEWKFQENSFKKVYMAELKAGDNYGPDWLPGCYEINNNLTRHTWTRGTEPALMITHVGDQGEAVKELPAPKRDLPKQIEPEKPADPVSNLLQKWGMVG